jgi:hypothetical protein
MRLALPLLVLMVVGACAGGARADVFGPISLASQSAIQQADYAHDPAISADGHYVAFDGSYGGVQGVWRRDLDGGTIEPVTVCATPSQPHPPTCDAQLPSISADGRYVSFTTTAALDPSVDENTAPDVYVRDMSRGETEAGAFALASAVNGGTQGLTYELTGDQQSLSGEPFYGSVASGRSALSADGRMVVFVTTSVSNLQGPGTPALQVAVRDLDTLSTRLVSVADDPATGAPAVDPSTGLPLPVSGKEGEETYGAVFAPGAPPPRLLAPAPYALTPPVGASISADGTTVAWMGQDVGEQARTLPDEALLPSYAEPLWRRIADGPGAPIRRVSGGGDPANPACAASGETVPLSPPSPADPCQGPFRVEAPKLGTFDEPTVDSVPQLSADGYTVAFLANAPTLAEGESFGTSLAGRHGDVYVADMHEGLTRAQALRTITELAGAHEDEAATNAPVVDFAISGDGTQVAFATQRTVFPLGVPAYVSTPAGVPGMAELFDADLSDETLTRVTEGFEGGAAEHPHAPQSAGVDPYQPSDGALSPSFSADGDTLAFSSTAANLVYGDGNTPPLGLRAFDGADVFTVGRVRFASQAVGQEISAPPPSPLLTPRWRLGVSALSARDGSVVLYVQAPGAGRLHVDATSAVAVRTGHAGHASHTGHTGAGHTDHTGAGRAGRADHARRTRVLVLTRTVARVSAAVGGGGAAQVRLVLGARYRALAEREGELSGEVTVAFVAAGHPVLRRQIAVTFARTSGRGRGASARRKRR